MGPDSPDGYGCDNMSVLIVQLKDRVKSRSRAPSAQPLVCRVHLLVPSQAGCMCCKCLHRSLLRELMRCSPCWGTGVLRPPVSERIRAQ